MKIIINIQKKHLYFLVAFLVILSVGFVIAQTPGVSHHAAEITEGVFNVARIPSLPASIITSGVLNVARIPNIPANKITTGTMTGNLKISGDLEVTGKTKLNCQLIDGPHPISCTTICTDNNKICLVADFVGGSLVECSQLGGSKKCLCC